MDFFDPQKQKLHNLRLNVGYVVIGLVLLLATTVALYYSSGFGLDKSGRVIQRGLVFVSSFPDKADVYIDGEKYKNATNTQLDLAAGQYVLELKRDGYRTWKRALVVEGGAVNRLEYPLLFPIDLTATATKKYDVAPSLSTQSPDHRWLLVASPGKDQFDTLDLSDREAKPQALTLSSEILAAGSTTTGWQLVEWSQDNRHVVLKRLYDRLGAAGVEYILLDREDVTQSQNLSIVLGLSPSSLALRDGAYDQYYVFDQPNGQLFMAELKAPTLRPHVDNVLAFAAEKDVVAYATTKGAEAGKVVVKIKSGRDEALTLSSLPADGQYLLDTATYDGKLYLATGAASDDRVLVYRDPLDSLRKNSDQPPVPADILKLAAPNFVAFSPGGRFVVAENADSFAVYDAENGRGYAYKVPEITGASSTHATWMDGYRLGYSGDNKTTIFDYDGVYPVTLDLVTPPTGQSYFSPDRRRLYTLNVAQELVIVELRTERDR